MLQKNAGRTCLRGRSAVRASKLQQRAPARKKYERSPTMCGGRLFCIFYQFLGGFFQLFSRPGHPAPPGGIGADFAGSEALCSRGATSDSSNNSYMDLALK